MEGPISSRNQDRHATRVDPSDVAHHLRVAADKYHENARILLEDMNGAIQALPSEQKPAYRQTREALAKIFDDQASDALRLAHLFDGIEGCELNAALASIESANARKAAQESIAQRVCDRLFAGKVNRPAVPEGRHAPASDHELMTAIGAAEAPDGGDLCTRCGAPIDHGDPHLECDTCRAGVPTTDHTACENEGSLQHTPTAPTTWIGNEQVNHQVGGEA